MMTSRRNSERLAAFERLGLQLVRHREDRWLIPRKWAMALSIMAAAALAFTARSSLGGEDVQWTQMVLICLLGGALIGSLYVFDLRRAYRLPRERRRLVGVGLTPDGLCDALLRPVGLTSPPGPVTTAAFVTAEDVSVFVGGRMFNLTRSNLYDARVGIARERVWLLIDADGETFALRLRGPVLGDDPLGVGVEATRESPDG